MPLPQSGERFADRYDVEQLIGRGGFASVYLARQTGINRRVALKVLARDITGRGDRAWKRFEREAAVMARLQSPNTVTMHDFGKTEDDMLYMVLEFIDGCTITELVEREGPLPPARAVELMRGMLESLREAHALGVLHRDIKPANVMVHEYLGNPNLVKVLDFGIAKKVIDPTVFSTMVPATVTVTAVNSIVGTPRYMSPEQILASDLDASSDLYSVGLIAFEMLTGKRAVNGATTLDAIREQLDRESFALPENLAVPEGLRTIVDRMLDKRVSCRYPSAEEVLTDLESWNRQGFAAKTIPSMGAAPFEARSLDELATQIYLFEPSDDPDRPMEVFDTSPGHLSMEFSRANVPESDYSSEPELALELDFERANQVPKSSSSVSFQQRPLRVEEPSRSSGAQTVLALALIALALMAVLVLILVLDLHVQSFVDYMSEFLGLSVESEYRQIERPSRPNLQH